MTQNLTANEHESLHLTHSSPSEWDTQGTLHLYDDTKNGSFAWWEKILIPIISGILIGGAAVGIAFSGNRFNEVQQVNATLQRYKDRAIQASGTRQKVLTDYSERISNLVVVNALKQSLSTDDIRKVARGETLIALRRLDDNGEGEKLIKDATDLLKSTAPLESIDALSGFNDAGDMKGLLVRFLFESKLLTDGNDPINPETQPPANNPVVVLSGANITRVVLENADLPRIDLRGAWLTGGNFQNAIMRYADLYDANLKYSNFENTDLRDADLEKADLSNSNLKKANLRRANLINTNLKEADLRGADLQETILNNANLEKADLRGATLAGANLNLNNACYNENTLIDSKHKVSMRDATGEDLNVPCKDLP